MKAKQQISANQMSFLFFIFMTGSSMINIPSQLIGYAKNGAWLSLLLSFTVGMVLLTCVLFLYNKFPNLTLIEYSQQLVGKWITFLLAIPFISFLLQMSSGIVLDIGLFMTSSMMRETPLHIFIMFIFLVVALTVRTGIEKVTRMFIILMITVLLFVMLILIIASTKYQPHHLFPVLPDGWNPVFLGAYYSFGFPYAELIFFSMLLPFVRQEEHRMLKKGMYLALMINVFFLITVTLSTILVFGPIAGDRMYSMFEVARTIDFYEVITRIESLIGYSLIVASYMKGVIAFYILNITLTHLFRLKDNRILIFPLTLTCFLYSMLLISHGQAYWLQTVSTIHSLWLTAALLPLLILMVIASLKKTM